MSRKPADTATVRTIRPHDTSEGLRQPGDEYERPKAEAEALAAQGIVVLLSK